MINSLTRKLLNVIQIVQQHAIDGLVVTLDVEKAFDRVSLLLPEAVWIRQ